MGAGPAAAGCTAVGGVAAGVSAAAAVRGAGVSADAAGGVASAFAAAGCMLVSGVAAGGAAKSLGAAFGTGVAAADSGILSVLCRRKRVVQTFTASEVMGVNLRGSSMVLFGEGLGFGCGVLMCIAFMSSTKLIGTSAGFMGVDAAAASAARTMGAGLTSAGCMSGLAWFSPSGSLAYWVSPSWLSGHNCSGGVVSSEMSTATLGWKCVWNCIFIMHAG